MIPEPQPASIADMDELVLSMRREIRTFLKGYQEMPAEEIVKRRKDRFRSYGVFD